MNISSNIQIEIIQGYFSQIIGLPVVTISVITYNSSKFILETLESIKKQTYPNIILQMSDDCSSDQTIDICKKWIEKNLYRFIKCKIIVPKFNTGVSANCNRACDHCETQYHKLIAGDDILLNNCITDNVKYVENHPDAIVVFSKARTFSVICGKKCDQGYKHDYDFFNKSPQEQYRYLIEIGNNIPASSVFVDIDKIRERGIRYDERIPLLEDYPQWIQMLRKGIKFQFLNQDTVLYRLNNDSLSIGLFSPKFYKDNMLLYLYYFLDEIKEEKDKDKVFNIIATQEARLYSYCYNFARNRKIVRLIDNITMPFIYMLRLIKSLFSKSIINES